MVLYTLQVLLSLFDFRIQLGELVKKIEVELQEAKITIKEKQLQHKNSVLAVSTLGKSIKENGNQRETRLKNLDKKIKSLKSDMQSAQKQLKVASFSVFNTSNFTLIYTFCYTILLYTFC